MSQAKSHPRSRILHANHYQRQVVWLVFIPSLSLCVLFTFFLLSLQRDVTNFRISGTVPSNLQLIETWGWAVLIATWVAFMGFLLWANVIANRMVGPFERLLRELDEVIHLRTVRKLRVRPGDDLAQQLLLRINFLLENIRWMNSSKPPDQQTGQF